MTATVITIGSLKGGVGKTKVSTNIAAELALRGYRTLLVDLDAQASATEDCGVETLVLDDDGEVVEEKLTVGHVLNASRPSKTMIRSVIQTVALPETAEGKEYSLDVAPANYQELDRAEIALKTPKGISMLATRVIDPVREDYDYIIIDTPPRIGALTHAGIYASDYSVPVVTPKENAYTCAVTFETAVLEEIAQFTPANPTVPFWIAACWTEDTAEGRSVLGAIEADGTTLLEPYLPVSLTASTIPANYSIPAVAKGNNVRFVQDVRTLVDALLEALSADKETR